MRSVSVRLADLNKVTIPIGFVGENLHTQVRIDCFKLFEDYPNAVPELTVNPPIGDAYPAVVTRDGGYVIWQVEDSDLVSVGNGEIQLSFFVDEVIAKSYIARTHIDKSLVATGDVPTPIENWIDNANEKLAEVEQWNNVTAEASTLAPGTSATVEITEENGHNKFEFGIPRGDNGDTGAPGFSPVIVVTDITGGHRVSVTDATETHTFDVMDGEKGDTGNGIASAVLNQDYTLTLNFTDGTHYTTPSIRGAKGETGDTGNGIASVTLNQDYTLTITYTNGQSTTTASIRGEKGETGATPVISIGTVTTLSPGSDATATMNTTDPEHPVLSFGIPEGEPGNATIDDTSTANNRVWSAQKTNDLKSALTNTDDNLSRSDSEIKVVEDATTVFETVGNALSYSNDTAGSYRYINGAWQLTTVGTYIYYHMVDYAVSDEKMYRVTGSENAYHPVATFWDSDGNMLGSSGDYSASQTRKDAVTLDLAVPKGATIMRVSKFDTTKYPVVYELSVKNNVEEIIDTNVFNSSSVSIADDGDTNSSNGIGSTQRWFFKDAILKGATVDKIGFTVYDSYTSNGSPFVVEIFELTSNNTLTLKKTIETIIPTSKAGQYVEIDCHHYVLKNPGYISFGQSRTMLTYSSSGTMLYIADRTSSTLSLSGLSTFIGHLNVDIVCTIRIPKFIQSAENVVYIGDGYNYEEIQDALDAITDDAANNPYTFVIFPKATPYKRFSTIRKLSESYPWSNAPVRYISMVGLDKYRCVIQDDKGDYSTPPAEILVNGTIRNLSFKATKTDQSATATQGAYAVHIDAEPVGNSGYVMKFEDCDFCSDQTAGVGIGLHNSSNLSFKNCRFESTASESYNPHTGYTNLTYLGAFNCHSSTNSNDTDQVLEIVDCVAISKETRAYNLSTNANCYMTLKAYCNTFWCEGTSQANGYKGSYCTIYGANHGNNASALNA